MASVLLISFAVAVGTVVMNLGRAQVVEQAECAIDIGLDQTDQVCYDQTKKQIVFSVQNGVNINVEGLIVSAVGSRKAQTIELDDAKMSKAAQYSGSIAFDKATDGSIRQFKITPKVVFYEEQQICLDQSITTETIPPC